MFGKRPLIGVDSLTDSDDTNCHCSTSKRARLDTTTIVSNTERTELTLLDIPTCALERVFEYLSAIDLFHVSRTCKSLHVLSKRPKFWSCMDGTVYKTEFHNERDAVLFMSNLNDRTTEFRIASSSPSSSILSLSSFNMLIDLSRNITVLALENQKLCSFDLRSSMLTQSLRELSLRNTQIRSSLEFFYNVQFHLINLHTLILDRCYWVVGHSLMALAKLPNLVNLSLADCLGIEDAFVYISLSMRFGFKSLRRLDLRRITCVRSFIDSLKGSPKVHELYLEKATKKKRDDFEDKINSMLKAKPPAVLCTRRSSNQNEVMFRVEIYDMNAVLLREVSSVDLDTSEIHIENCSRSDDELLTINSAALLSVLRTREFDNSDVTIEGSDKPKLFRPGFPLQPAGRVTIVARNFNRVTDRFLGWLTDQNLLSVRLLDLTGCAITNETFLKSRASFPSVQLVC